MFTLRMTTMVNKIKFVQIRTLIEVWFFFNKQSTYLPPSNCLAEMSILFILREVLLFEM